MKKKAPKTGRKKSSTRAAVSMLEALRATNEINVLKMLRACKELLKARNERIRASNAAVARAVALKDIAADEEDRRLERANRLKKKASTDGYGPAKPKKRRKVTS